MRRSVLRWILVTVFRVAVGLLHLDGDRNQGVDLIEEVIAHRSTGMGRTTGDEVGNEARQRASNDAHRLPVHKWQKRIVDHIAQLDGFSGGFD